MITTPAGKQPVSIIRIFNITFVIVGVLTGLSMATRGIWRELADRHGPRRPRVGRHRQRCRRHLEEGPSRTRLPPRSVRGCGVPLTHRG